MCRQLDLGPAGLSFQLGDELVQAGEQLRLDDLNSDRVESGGSGYRRGGSRVVLDDLDVVLRVAVLDEAQLLGLELRARPNVPVHEDHRILGGSRLRAGRWRHAEEA